MIIHAGFYVIRYRVKGNEKSDFAINATKPLINFTHGVFKKRSAAIEKYSRLGCRWLKICRKYLVLRTLTLQSTSTSKRRIVRVGGLEPVDFDLVSGSLVVSGGTVEHDLV